MHFRIAGEPFCVELAPGGLADALATAFSAFGSAPDRDARVLRFAGDARPLPQGVRTMPVVAGARITGAGFEASLNGRDASVVGANERFGIESVLKVMLASALLPAGKLLVHSVAVGGAVLLGESGAGKSTLGALGHAAGLSRLADELVVIGADGVVHGTPWNVGLNQSAALKLLGTLGWSDVERVEPIAPSDFLPMLLSNTLLPDDLPATRTAVFGIAARLLERTPPERFYFSPTPAAPAFLRELLISRADPSRRPRGG